MLITYYPASYDDDVVLAFVTPPQQSLNDPRPPITKLFGFERVHLDLNQATSILFSTYQQ